MSEVIVMDPSYSQESFWKKLRENAKKAGKKVVYDALVLHYAVQSPDTPNWAKAVCLSALVYFIVPVDAIPDIIPGAGYIDDAAVLAGAIWSISLSITSEIKAQARKKMRDWFDEPWPPENGVSA